MLCVFVIFENVRINMIIYIDFSNYLKIYKFKLTLPLEAGKALFISCYFYGYNLELYFKLIQGH